MRLLESIKITALVGSIFNRVIRFTRLLIIALMMTLTAVVIYDVIARYLFNSPTVFAGEISRMIQVTFATLGAAYVLQQEEHVSVEILVMRLNTRLQALIDGITSAIAVFFSCILVWLLWDLTKASFIMGERTVDIGWLLWPVKLIATIGILLLGFQFIAHSCKHFAAIKSIKKSKG
jgi:C4-dicarboxylate transporter DctQ subunit